MDDANPMPVNAREQLVCRETQQVNGAIARHPFASKKLW
jgi:hypothetical protein